MYKHILLAADLNEKDDAELSDKAQALAKAFGAELSLLHVVEMIYNYGIPDSDLNVTEWQEELKSTAKEKLGRLGAKIGVPANRQHVLVGGAKEWILREADELKIDLIVVGSHHRSGIAGFILGSTAEGVLHGAKCDVFAVQVEG